MNDSVNYVPNTQDAQGGRTIYFDIGDVFKRTDTSVYSEAVPIPKYADMLKEFKRMGYRIGIIATSSPDKMEEAKQQWLQKNTISPYVDSFQLIPQGVSKYEVAEDKTGVLVSDDDKALNTWFSDRIKIIK